MGADRRRRTGAARPPQGSRRAASTAQAAVVNAGGDDALNAMLAAAQGEYILPLAAGSVLRPHALLDLALTVAQLPAAQLDLFGRGLQGRVRAA